jgi:MbtH protein
MAWDEEHDSTIYKVVVNHEEQYSIWPGDRENPLGWKDAGKSGPKAECLAYVEEVWTDMRPLSLRKHMEEMARQPAPPNAAALRPGYYHGGPPRQPLGARQSSRCRCATPGAKCTSPERGHRSRLCAHQVYRHKRRNGARRQARQGGVRCQPSQF